MGDKLGNWLLFDLYETEKKIIVTNIDNGKYDSHNQVKTLQKNYSNVLNKAKRLFQFYEGDNSPNNKVIEVVNRFDLRDIHFYTGTMGSGKSKTLIEMYHKNKIGKRISLFSFTQSSQTGESILIKSRNGSCMYGYALNINDNVETLSKYMNDILSVGHGTDEVYIDEVQFYNVFDLIEKVNVEKETKFVLFGLSHDFKGEIFDNIGILLKNMGHGFPVVEIEKVCDIANCSHFATENVRKNSSKNLYVEDKDLYLSVCIKHSKQFRNEDI